LADGIGPHARSDEGGPVVYWKPAWNIVGDGAFELMVARAAHIKNVPGRAATRKKERYYNARSPARQPPSEKGTSVDRDLIAYAEG
jgi:hypothetical protein